MIRLKEGVSLVGMQPQLSAVWQVAEGIWADEGAPELVVTSVNDGQHSTTSLHWAGAAVDLRTKNLPSDAAKRRAKDRLKAVLGRDFDVILEKLGQAHEHVHVEWQPRAR